MRAVSRSFGGSTVTSAGIATLADKSCVPMISVSSGTMGNNGALSAITALDRTYAKCFMFFPAGAIAAGVPAAGGAWLYVEMSSATAGTVFNNTYTTGPTTIPASKVAFATTGPGAFVGDTTEQGVLLSVPGGALGTTGATATYLFVSGNATAGAKTVRVRYGGIAGTVYFSSNITSNQSLPAEVVISNAGLTNAQVGPGLASATSYGFNAAQPVTSNVDTTAAFTIAVTLQKGVATDNFVLQAAIPEIFSNGV